MKQSIYVVQCPRCHEIAGVEKGPDLLPGKTCVLRLCERCDAKLKAKEQAEE